MAARKKIIGGNWKSNPASVSTVKELCTTFAGCKFDQAKAEAVVFPVTLHGPAAMEGLKGSGFEVGIQNISKTGCGAFTGEVTAGMALEAGYTWCLIGHSERRTRYGETDADTFEKLKAAQEAGLKVIFCIGELLEEREGGKTEEVNERQLAGALPLVADWDKFVIAYEPVWAIGTGKVATPDQAQETQAAIRAYVAKQCGDDKAAKVRIQYGGSANAANCGDLSSKPDIDGFLVGGASLKPEFTQIIETTAAA
eukprot:gnl/TRDRNA2_/TRDRNA2_181638_c0_seq1.p1 gnl/TRDRNA2_/TRDRNA2_181638_c0~~gnl/TRDRNA2_/TRDRNA2_181638_c0_seq1.p1  ORF type:complete len:254 (-),score=75.48 gnl/TRDRNA2_/TRDRNA2_181638_c0_seq1:60-821(-)